jgi:hypothetical protein
MEFDHIALVSTNIPKDIDSYRSLFSEIGILYQDESWALIKAGGVKIALVTPGQHPPHLAFLVKTRESLEEMAKEHNSTVKVHRDRSESFYTTDSSGNAIEVVFYPEKT